MKRENEDFYYWSKNHKLTLLDKEYLNLADFKSVFRFLISSLDQRLQPSGVGLFWPYLMVFGHISPSSKGLLTFDRKKIRKI